MPDRYPIKKHSDFLHPYWRFKSPNPRAEISIRCRYGNGGGGVVKNGQEHPPPISSLLNVLHAAKKRPYLKKRVVRPFCVYKGCIVGSGFLCKFGMASRRRRWGVTKSMNDELVNTIVHLFVKKKILRRT